MEPIDIYDTAAQTLRERPAVIDGQRTVTFGELTEMSHAIAEGITPLVDRRAPGAPVAVLSPNDYRVLACMLGTWRARAAVVPLHARSSTDQNAGLLARVRPACVFYHSAMVDHVRPARRSSEDALWVCIDKQCGDDPSLESWAGAIVSAGRTSHSRQAGSLCARGDFGRPVFIRQTSGTTGPPKLVADDVVSFNTTQRVLRQMLDVGVPSPACLVVAPLSHAAGVHMFAALSLGATIVILREFDPAEIVRAIQRYRITHLWLPPTALQLLVDYSGVHEYDHSSLVSLTVGAAASAPQLLVNAVKQFGRCVCLNYSQIDSGFLTWLDQKTIAACVDGTHPERLASSGKSTFAARLAIMDDNGTFLPPDECGEIVVRGMSLKDYVDIAEAAASRRDGWHHSGDLGYFDQSGYLYVVGRKADVIITAGFKVNAADVERAILELEDVRECAVIGVPDPVRGEMVGAVVVARAGGAIDPARVIAHCRARVGTTKAPRTVEEWAELPKTAVGKVDKLAILKRYSPSARAAGR